MDKATAHKRIFEAFPYLKACANPDFSRDNLNADCEKLSDDLVKLQDKEQDTSTEAFTEEALPKLETKSLDEEEVKNGIKLLSEVFENETIIPDICRTHVMTSQEADIKTLGASLRLPIELFKKTTGDTVYCNDMIFSDLGRNIAFAERILLNKVISSQNDIEKIIGDFTAEKIIEGIEKVAKSGHPPELIFPTIADFLYLHRSKDVKLEYPSEHSKINAFLTVGKYRLGIVAPLGHVPTTSFIFSKQAITWKARSYGEHGALSISFGLDRLYPLRFVELIAVERVKCEADSQSIVKLELKPKNEKTDAKANVKVLGEVAPT